MDWKPTRGNTQIDIGGKDIILSKSIELPQEEIRGFIRKLVDTILFQKRSAGLILPDSGPTHPENYQELIALIRFSYEVLTQAWSRVLGSHGITHIPMPTLQIIQENETPLQDFLGLCYMIEEEAIRVDPFFLQFFHHKIYAGSEDFSILYAIAHEIAHHIQKYIFSPIEVEYTHEATIFQRQIDDILDLRIFSLRHHFKSHHQAEQIVELHADYLAGVIIHHANRHKPFLHENDIREGLETALHVGDDLRQWKAGRTITPETFMHGRCDQRVLAFAKGLETGELFRFTLEDIAQIFFEQGAHKPAHESVTIF